MDFPPGYTLALTPEEIGVKWPNLMLGTNSRITSLKRKGHNCVAYAIGEINKDADMLVFSKRFDLSLCGLSNTNLDHSVAGYSKLLSHFYNFNICNTQELEKGFEKIALYEGYDVDGEKGFLHIALQLKNGKWTSKLGIYEDIEHDTLDVLAGNFYGNPVLYMKRPEGMHKTLL